MEMVAYGHVGEGGGGGVRSGGKDVKTAYSHVGNHEGGGACEDSKEK